MRRETDKTKLKWIACQTFQSTMVIDMKISLLKNYSVSENLNFANRQTYFQLYGYSNKVLSQGDVFEIPKGVGVIMTNRYHRKV